MGQSRRKMKTITRDVLAENDGRNGKPAFVACDGIVYDISESKRWKNGQHMRRHEAGRDLTADIQAAPHQQDLLERFPRVGMMQTIEETTRPMPEWLAWMLRTNPFLRRHPHPMTVHFPIAFILAHPLFLLLYLITGNTSFDTSAFHCLGCGVLAMAAAMVTGFFTWWYNYQAKIMPVVMIKIILSSALFVIAMIEFIWRIADPSVLTAAKTNNPAYVVLSLGMIPLISAIGWFGATLTFPIVKKSK
jgi:predicted heme/steroid binding protein/uncharacterized membrane protein